MVLALNRRLEQGRGPFRLEGVEAEVVDAEGCVAQDDDALVAFIEIGDGA